MQENLIVDYLEGRVESKNDSLKSYKYLCDYYKYVKPVSSQAVIIDGNNAHSEVIPPEVVIDYLRGDPSLVTFLRAYYEYKTRPHKNYVVASTLTKAFSETKLDIKGKYLPKDFTAFFEIRGLVDHEGDEIKGVFTRLSNESLILGMITYDTKTKRYSASHYHTDMLKDEESLEDKVKEYTFVEIGSNLKNKSKEAIKEIIKEGVLEKTEYEAEYFSHLHVIFNCILYVTHNPELKEEINTFDTKKSKRDWQLKNWTQKPYIFVGRNFQAPRVYSSEEIAVRGHWRWQPYGLDRSLIKHIYIEPYLKNRSLH